MKHYHYTFDIALHDTDAAGVLFFAHLFRHAHDAYEAFMLEIGFPLPRLIENQLAIPIVHSEASFLQPIRHGDKINIQLHLSKIGNSSFVVQYSFLNPQQQPLANATTSHVNLNTKLQQNETLPGDLRLALTNYCVNS